MIRLYAILPQTRALGPYIRFAVWVQGCPRRCAGCMTPSAQAEDGGTLVSINALSRQIIATPDIEGLTISGGEPFAQAEALARLLQKVKTTHDLGVIAYTGYELDELQRMAVRQKTIDTLLNQIDLLIDGPYIESLNDGLSLRGSDNQGLYLLTQRYTDVLQKYYCRPQRAVELHLHDREVLLAGIPGREMATLVRQAGLKPSACEKQE